MADASSGRRVRWILCGTIVVLLGAWPARAQDEAALRTFFEGKRVTLRMDMPGTSDGIDVRPESHEPLDYRRYRDELAKYETAIRSGDRVTVTLVKIKKDLVEFQLAGGGFGTFWDDTSTSIDMPLKEKSEREKRLEERVRTEEDHDKRRELKRELDQLRDQRERDNRRIMEEREIAEERKRDKVAAQRRAGGARFNIRYDESVPAGLRPGDVMEVLSPYVDFGLDARTADVRLPWPAASGGWPRVGMPRAEAERLFGKPIESFDRWDGSRSITMLVFDTGEERITTEFVENVMIRYTIMSK
jgi:hypothetical protein